MNGHQAAAAIIVKLKYEDDFRRATLSTSEINTYDAMTSWIAETYNLYGDNNGGGTTRNLLLKYKDEDGDLITMTNNDDLEHALTTQQKLFIHVFICDDTAALNNSSRLASPIKSSDSQAAIIHPSSHVEEQDGRQRIVAAGLSLINIGTSPQHEQQQVASYPGKPETPKHFGQHQSSNEMHPQQGQLQSPSSSQPRAGNRDKRFDSSSSVIAMSPQRQQQQQVPSYPSAATTQQFVPPMSNGLPPPQQHQLQQQSFIGMHSPPSSQQHHHQVKQQRMPSYPLSPSAPTQHVASPSLNGLPPSHHYQQQPPSYSSQSTVPPPSYIPPASTSNGYGLPPSLQKQQSYNGLPPPPSSSSQQQHHQVRHPQSGQQQQMPYPPLSAPPLGPPPTSTVHPGLGNPFARQQYQQRPGQR